MRRMIGAAALAALCLASPAGAQERYLVFAGGSTGGAFFIVAAGLARMVEKAVPNTRVTAQVTAGTIENIRLMAQKRADCALVAADGPYQAERSEGPFSKEKYTNIRYVTRGYSSALQALVLDESPVKSLADLKGKRVGILIGPTQDYFPVVSKAYGLEYAKDYRISVLRVTELINALRDGNIDVAIYFGAAPTSTVSDIVTAKAVRFLPVEAKEAAEVTRALPYLYAGPVERSAYGLAADVPSMRVPILFACRDDVPDDIVYAITKVLLGTPVDELKTIHAEAPSFGLANAGKSVVVAMHPGAERYYRERNIPIEK